MNGISKNEPYNKWKSNSKHRGDLSQSTEEKKNLSNISEFKC